MTRFQRLVLRALFVLVAYVNARKVFGGASRKHAMAIDLENDLWHEIKNAETP